MKTDGTNAVAKTQQKSKEEMSLKDWLSNKVMTRQIAMALPRNITPERMTRIAMTALTRDEKLAQTTPQSFMGALLTSAQLGLECNTPLGQAYLIPYWNGKAGRLETQFQIGYQGMLDLCYRTKQYKTIQARVVYEGDEFEYSYGFDEKLSHKPCGKTDNPTFVYAYYELISGGRAFEVMAWEEVKTFARHYSQSVKNNRKSPWDTDPEAMAKKTVLKKVMKYAPKTVEIANAVANDSAILTTSVVNNGEQAFIDVVAQVNDTEPSAQIEASAQQQIPRNNQTSQSESKESTESLANQAMQVSPEEEVAINAAWENAEMAHSTPDELF